MDTRPTDTAPTRPGMTRAEWLWDGIVHGVGLVLLVAAVPVLITLAVVQKGDPIAVVAVAVYGATAILLFITSALYNLVENPRWTGVFRRLDHSAIFFKIAGTYTPFALLAGPRGAIFAIGIWACAVFGSALKIAMPDRFRWTRFFLCLGMGWSGVALGWPLFEDLPDGTIALILAGGVVYTLGTIFYLAERLPFHTPIWHLFVLVATGLFFAAVTLRVLHSDLAEELVPDLVPGAVVTVQ